MINEHCILEDQYRIRLKSKKLTSGRYQVKFQAIVNEKDIYGYLLVDPQVTLFKVVKKIKCTLLGVEQSRDYQHLHLFNIKEKSAPSPLMIFQPCR